MGDYINSYLYNFDDNERFFKAAKKTGFSKDSINSLFDVDGDGVFSAVEKDRAESVALINELSSIHPLVARSYNDINFQIQTGSFLTKQQYTNIEKFKAALSSVAEMLSNPQSENIKHEQEPEDANEYLGDPAVDLKTYLLDRQALYENSIDNDV